MLYHKQTLKPTGQLQGMSPRKNTNLAQKKLIPDVLKLNLDFELQCFIRFVSKTFSIQNPNFKILPLQNFGEGKKMRRTFHSIFSINVKIVTNNYVINVHFLMFSLHDLCCRRKFCHSIKTIVIYYCVIESLKNLSQS